MTLELLLLSGLATWRLTSLLHTEGAFEWLRKWIGIGHDDEGHPAVYPEHTLGKIFQCFWCLTLFAGMPVVSLLIFGMGKDRAWSLPLWLASSAFAIWLEKQIMRTQSR